jgi:predicted TIM-barrel enzyme
VTTANVEKYLPEVDGIIVGSFLKEKGYWANPVDPRRVEDLMKKVKGLV